MGGYGSGRSGGRPTVQDSLTLDLRYLLKMGLLMPSARTMGELRWTWGATGREIASMGCQSQLGKDSGYVRLYWTSTNLWTGETCERENRIALTTKAQPFGGRRWFFICPHTGRTATKLHLPSGASTFACREAYRLGYRSQRETPHDRSFSRAFTLREKIGGKGGIGDYIGKPKGMHWRTFERGKERVDDAEKIVLVHSARWLARLSGHRRKRTSLSRPDGPLDDGAIN
jgi:hypothetical protein